MDGLYYIFVLSVANIVDRMHSFGEEGFEPRKTLNMPMGWVIKTEICPLWVGSLKPNYAHGLGHD